MAECPTLERPRSCAPVPPVGEGLSWSRGASHVAGTRGTPVEKSGAACLPNKTALHAFRWPIEPADRICFPLVPSERSASAAAEAGRTHLQ